MNVHQRVSEVEVSQEFSAIIKKPRGKAPAIVVNSKAYYEYQLSKFKDGERATLVITNRWPKRTNQQNRYYWSMILPMVAQETGEDDVEKLHEYFKSKYLTTGIHVVLGERVRMTKSTTELSVEEFSKYIKQICFETNCIPPPTENWNLAKL